MSRDESLYWPAEFAHQKIYKDEVKDVDVSCHVTLGTPNQAGCLKAAHNFNELYDHTLILNPEAKPRFSISGMSSPSESIQHRAYALMNVFVSKLRNRDWIERKDSVDGNILRMVGGKPLPSVLRSSNRYTHRPSVHQLRGVKGYQLEVTYAHSFNNSVF